MAYTVTGTQCGGSVVKWQEECQRRARARFDYCRSSESFVRAEIIGPDGQFIARWKK
nr:MAG TPA: hypothetical protein [Caudoviricetes sp.]